MNTNLRRFWLPVGLIVLVGGGFLAYQLWGGISVPREFKESREKGAFVSERIVKNSASLVADLDRVNQLEKENKFEEAGNLTEELAERNKEVKTDALELANQLEKMTIAVPEIDNKEARSLALEAINHEISVVTHLLSYNGFVDILLENLQDRFRRNRDLQVRSWIEEINNQVVQINDFNSKAKQAFEKFDSLVK